MDAVDFSRAVFPVLALVANALTVALLIGPVRRRLFTTPRGPLALAGAVAATATAGSLFLSEAAGFIPCVLCWYQRIAMYPLAAITAIALIRRDVRVWVYAVPIAVIGFGVSVWHYLVEHVPALSEATSCSLEAPCNILWIDAYGFVTIPYMAGSAFALIAVSTLVAASLAGAGPKVVLTPLVRAWKLVPRPARIAVVAAVGSSLVLLGLALVVLPGPFTLPLVVAGLAVLASEFTWAAMLLERARAAAGRGVSAAKRLASRS